jgi:hypothetical protein
MLYNCVAIGKVRDFAVKTCTDFGNSNHPTVPSGRGNLWKWEAREVGKQFRATKKSQKII